MNVFHFTVSNYTTKSMNLSHKGQQSAINDIPWSLAKQEMKATR